MRETNGRRRRRATLYTMFPLFTTSSGGDRPFSFTCDSHERSDSSSARICTIFVVFFPSCQIELVRRPHNKIYLFSHSRNIEAYPVLHDLSNLSRERKIRTQQPTTDFERKDDAIPSRPLDESSSFCSESISIVQVSRHLWPREVGSVQHNDQRMNSIWNESSAMPVVSLVFLIPIDGKSVIEEILLGASVFQADWNWKKNKRALSQRQHRRRSVDRFRSFSRVRSTAHEPRLSIFVELVSLSRSTSDQFENGKNKLRWQV